MQLSQEVKDIFGVKELCPSISPEEIVQTVLKAEGIDEEPIFIVNLSQVVKKFEEWKENLPTVEPYYAVKCNPNPAILHTLKSLGVKFDCASRGEIETVLQLPNATPNDIIFANPCKPKSHLQFAHANGVQLMTFDNAAELLKIKQNHPDAHVILRIITNDSNSLCQFSNKFGARMRDVPYMLRICQEVELNLVGVSFHVGSGCRSVGTYIDALLNAKKVFEMAEERGMKPLTILDIGGGFPGDDSFDGLSFPELCKGINPYLSSLFPTTRIIAEPGRYFAASSSILVTNVIAIRRVIHGDSAESALDEPLETPEGDAMQQQSEDFLVYVNDGVYGSFNNILYDHQAPKPNALYARGQYFRTTIFGPTCDGLDCIVKGGYLPRVEIGEWLYFKDMGAYTLTAGSTFNGFPRPHVFYVC